MSLLSNMLSMFRSRPHAAITDSGDLARAMKSLSTSSAGLTADSAMKIAAVFRAVSLISGTVGTMPISVKRRIDDRTRLDARDDVLWTLLKRRPNSYQTPAQFKRMMQASVLLTGKAVARKVFSRGRVIELLPLESSMVEVERTNGRLEFVVNETDGQRMRLEQDEVFHLVGLSLDGFTGVSVLKYARDTIGAALTMERHGARMFANGAIVSGVLRHPGRLGPEAVENLRKSIESFSEGGAREGRSLILEEGMTYERMSLTAEDAQWIESRKFSRTDIAMFFGVPPHMLGDTEKSTSFGAGLEQQTVGFQVFTMEDHLTMWEETIQRDLIPPGSDLYVRFNRAALVRGDIETRWNAYVKAMQWGVLSPNEVRTLEDRNPRDGGDVYYDPPNTAGTPAQERQEA